MAVQEGRVELNFDEREIREAMICCFDVALPPLVANAPWKRPANPFSLIHADQTVTMAAFLFAMMHQF